MEKGQKIQFFLHKQTCCYSTPRPKYWGCHLVKLEQLHSLPPFHSAPFTTPPALFFFYVVSVHVYLFQENAMNRFQLHALFDLFFNIQGVPSEKQFLKILYRIAISTWFLID